MKITCLTVILPLLLIGCSKQDRATTQPRLALARGDLAAPVEITTNASGPSPVYNLQIKLSAAKEAELLKFARKHPNETVQIVLGDRVLTDLRMPGGEAGKISTIGVAAAIDSPSEAQSIAELLNQLVK